MGTEYIVFAFVIDDSKFTYRYKIDLLFISFQGKLSKKKNLSNRCCRIEYNGSPSKNSDIKTPLVVSFSLGILIQFGQNTFYKHTYIYV